MAEELLLLGPIIARALEDDERERRKTFSGSLSYLRSEIPKMEIDRDQAVAIVERYHLREYARQIVESIFPRKL